MNKVTVKTVKNITDLTVHPADVVMGITEGVDGDPMGAHSIQGTTDTLAIYNLFATIDPSLNVETITDILQAMPVANNWINGDLRIRLQDEVESNEPDPTKHGWRFAA